MIPAHKLTHSQQGSPSEVIQVQELKEIDEIPENHVGIRLIASPINPSDLGTIQGSYGSLQELPATPGREGVGEVFKTGLNVNPTWIGTLVRMPENLGAWQEFCIAPVHGLWKIPENLPTDMAAQAFINPPTAYLLLKTFVQLKPGDWIIQNGANSAVGHCVIQLAKHWGFKTLNVVRDSYWETPLKKYGADKVVPENSAWEKDLKLLTDGNLPKLALNSIGGISVSRLIKATAPGGTVVTFGGMVQDPIRFPTRYLIFNDITLKGFWLKKFLQSLPESETISLYNKIFQLIKGNVLTIPVEKKYSLEAAEEALRHAEQGNRRGKILFQSNWWPNLHA